PRWSWPAAFSIWRSGGRFAWATSGQTLASNNGDRERSSSAHCSAGHAATVASPGCQSIRCAGHCRSRRLVPVDTSDSSVAILIPPAYCGQVLSKEGDTDESRSQISRLPAGGRLSVGVRPNARATERSKPRHGEQDDARTHKRLRT